MEIERRSLVNFAVGECVKLQITEWVESPLCSTSDDGKIVKALNVKDLNFLQQSSSCSQNVP